MYARQYSNTKLDKGIHIILNLDMKLTKHEYCFIWGYRRILTVLSIYI
jgi:hypothetical protein